MYVHMLCTQKCACRRQRRYNIHTHVLYREAVSWDTCQSNSFLVHAIKIIGQGYQVGTVFFVGAAANIPYETLGCWYFAGHWFFLKTWQKKVKEWKSVLQTEIDSHISWLVLAGASFKPDGFVPMYTSNWRCHHVMNSLPYETKPSRRKSNW